MSRSRIVNTGCCVAGGLLLVAGSMASPAQQVPQAQPAPQKPLVDATHKIMEPEEALTGASVRVVGDQSQPGMYVFRNRFGPGQTSRPHYHDQDRLITVIKGTWWVGEGDVFQPDKMVPIRQGGFMFHPAGYHHYDGSKDDEVIVQIVGMGPVKTIQSEVDEKGQPVKR